MTAGRTPKPAQAMCVVMVDLFALEVLLPIADGLALVKLLAKAEKLDRSWCSDVHGKKFRVVGPVAAELRTVSLDEIAADRVAGAGAASKLPRLNTVRLSK